MKKMYNMSGNNTYYFVGTASEIKPIYKSMLRAWNKRVSNITPLCTQMAFCNSMAYGIAINDRGLLRFNPSCFSIVPMESLIAMNLAYEVRKCSKDKYASHNTIPREVGWEMYYKRQALKNSKRPYVPVNQIAGGVIKDESIIKDYARKWDHYLRFNRSEPHFWGESEQATRERRNAKEK